MIANLVVALIIPIHSANLSTNMPENDQAVGWNPSQLPSARAMVTNHAQEVRDSMTVAGSVETTRELDQAFVDAIQRYQQERQQQLALEHAMGASESLFQPPTRQPQQLVATGIDLGDLGRRVNDRYRPVLTETGKPCSLLAEDVCDECGLRLSHRVDCSRFDRKGIQLPHVHLGIGEVWHPSQLQPTEQPASSPLPVDINGNYRTIRLPAGRCERHGDAVSVTNSAFESMAILVGAYAGQVLGGDGNLYYDVFYRADYQQPGEVLAMAREHWDHGSGFGSIDLLSDHRRDAALRRQARMLGDRNIVNPAGEIALGDPMIGAPIELNGQVIGRLMGVDHAAGRTTVSVSMHEQRPANTILADFTITPQGAHERNPDEPA